MRRPLLTAAAVLLFGGLVALPIAAPHLKVAATAPPPAVSASTSAEPKAVPKSVPALTVSETPDAGPDADTADGPVFDRLPDGGAVPDLPAEAPKSVRFGAVLFEYNGAQLAASSARSRDQARELAEKTLELAKQDFGAAVKKGDPGSVDNAGALPRGVLEKSLEYALFSLDPGELHPEPLDTPRGYWVVKRLK